MKTKFNGILTLLLAFVVQIAFAQDRTISGTVSDEGGALPGVSVLKKGTMQGVETDFDGNYSIKAKTGDVLVFSYVGMKTVEKTVGSSNKLDIIMEGDNVLEEVVIEAAYDIKRAKPKVNVSITSVGSETIENRPNASIIQTLQGQAPGVNIATGSGQPGADSEVIIRGVGSLSGNVEPLFIIDGVPVDKDNFRSLNTNNIASVNVLKDAGATAIYGNRGANGVIIIKTKSGKYNSPLKIEYSTLTSFSTLQGNSYNLMNSKEQLELEREYGKGRGAGISDIEIAAISKFSNTNWVDVFFRTGTSQSHNLRLSGGSNKTNTNITLGFLDQEGILVQSGLKRFNLDSKINGKSENEKFNYGVSLSLNYSKSDEPNRIGEGAVNRNYVLGAYQSVPYVSPSQYVFKEGGSIAPVFSNTPLLLLDRLYTYTRFEEELKSIASLNASYELLEGLKLSSRLGLDYTSEFSTRTEAPYSFNSAYFAQTGDETPGTQDQQSNRSLSANVLNSLSYVGQIGEDHNFDAGLYMEITKAHYRGFGYRARGLDPKTFSPGDGSGFISDNSNNDYYIDDANANVLNSGLLSYFVNLNYDYKEKYGFGATLRRDASFRFIDENKWGTFWSLSGRWNIDKEKFMEGSSFSMLKLRGSYGITGNQDIIAATGYRQYFSAATLTQDLYSTNASYGGNNSIIIGTPSNKDLKWETKRMLNLGVDFEVLNKRLTGSLDFYKSTTKDLFANQPTPSIFGVTSLRVNSKGELINKGVDLLLGYKLFNKNDLKLKLNFSGNYNKSERYGADLVDVREGGKLYEYFTVRYAGVNPANGQLLYLDKDGNLTENPNEEKDRVFLDKNRYPDYQGSFGFDAEYKGFFMTTSLTYAIGVDRYDFDYAGYIDPGNIGNFRHSRDILRAWNPNNRITDIPSLRATNLDISSDRFIQSGDYLRLRNVSLGYNFSQKTLEKIKLSKIRIFLTGENLVTFAGWRGFDVEGFTNSSSRRYPTPRTMSFGLEIGL